MDQQKNYNYPAPALLDVYLQPFVMPLIHATQKLPVIWSVSDKGIQVRELADMSCILVAGSPGSGKTNFIHQLIMTLLYKKHPVQIKFILADYKGLDLPVYRSLEKAFLAKLKHEDALITDAQKLLSCIKSLSRELDNRYALFQSAGTRNIDEYNKKIIDRKLDFGKGHLYLPAIILFIDNFDGYSIQLGNEITDLIIKLVKEGYKAGIHTVLSMTEISHKALPVPLLHLIPERVAFRLHDKDDYKKLFETTKVKASYTAGDFHYNYQGSVQEGHSPLIAIENIENLVQFISEQQYGHYFYLPEAEDAYELDPGDFDLSDRDALFEDAARLIVLNQVGSTSLLQRRLKLGYNRTGRLMDQLEAAGIVGPNLGSKARDVLIKNETELQQHLDLLG